MSTTRSRENVNFIKRGWVFFENKKIRLRRKLLKRKIIFREKIIFVWFFYLVILIITNFLWEKKFSMRKNWSEMEEKLIHLGQCLKGITWLIKWCIILCKWNNRNQSTSTLVPKQILKQCLGVGVVNIAYSIFSSMLWLLLSSYY